MTEIVMVRHGETELNREGIFRGRLDVALNERGRLQAEWVAAALAGEPLDAVYTSPLRRAVDTATAVASAHGLSPIPDEAFNNIDLGAWQGRKKSEVEADEPALWDLWIRDPERLEIPGGETLARVRERATARARTLADLHGGGRFAVVSHRSVLKLLAGALLGFERDSFWRFYLDNAAYSVIGRRDDEYVLLRWNENCHLREKVVEER